MLNDLRHAVRLFARSRGFALSAVLMLALGIGANTAIFSIVDAAVLRPLPYTDPDRLVTLNGVTPRGLSDSWSPRVFLDWRDEQQVFEGITAIGGGVLVIAGDPEPEELRVNKVTADFFRTFGVRPMLGAAFGYEAETPGRDRVVVISHAFWQRRFGGAMDVVGRTLTTDKGAYEIAGVLPTSFTYPPGRGLDLFVPLAFTVEDRQPGTLQSSYLGVVARLKNGLAADQATAQINQLNDRLEDRRRGFNKGRRVQLIQYHEVVTGRARSWMVLLLGAVAFVLLIASVNVASLLLAHGADRVRELTVRAALGASPWRLARQMFAESLVIAACGAAGGFVLAWWGVEALRAAIPPGIPRSSTIGIDLRVLGFTALVALATAVVCGVLPAIVGARVDIAEGLKEGTRSATSGRVRRVAGQFFAFAEVAGALILLIGAGLFLTSFARVMAIDPGFNTSNLVTMYIDLPDAMPEKTRPQYAAAIVSRVREIPGVASAAMSYGARPFSPENMSLPYAIPGRPAPPAKDNLIVRTVTPEYLPMLGISVRRGRPLDARDDATRPSVALVNESAARKLFAGEDPIGKRIEFRDGSVEIVGVAADARAMGRERQPVPEAFVPMAQRTLGTGASLTVRVAGRVDAIVPAIKARIFEMVPGRPITDIETVESAARRSAAPRRFNMLLLSIFAVVALGIAATGIYSLLAYVVRRRTHEIGIRLALGATRRDVARLIAWQGAVVIVPGIAAGLAGAWMLARSVQAFLFEIEPRHPLVFTVAAIVLTAAGALACWLPARRAAAVDPLRALRVE